MLALTALFLKMPETPDFFGILNCKSCSSSDPYLPLTGAAYFSAIVALSLLFPRFPGPILARGGLVWAISLAFALTYIDYPKICAICLIGHACNILIWAIWVIAPVRKIKNKLRSSSLSERLCLMLFAPVSIVALFSCLNLTFRAYDLKSNYPLSSGLRIGEKMPEFTFLTIAGRSISNVDSSNSKLVMNFISPTCPYCKEQQQILNEMMPELSKRSYRVINITPNLPSEMDQCPPHVEWVEDKEGNLRNLFQVSGYPTLFVGIDDKIAKIILGVPDKFKAYLIEIVEGP